MLRLLRRSRLLALALLLATPALGGAWLQAAHPCPSEAPWVGQQHAGGEHEGHGGQESPGSCHCVGTCAGAALAMVPAASELRLAVIPAFVARLRVVPAAVAPTPPPSDRLPPATAPPLA